MSLRIQPCLRSTLVHLSRSVSYRARVLCARQRSLPQSTQLFLTKSFHQDAESSSQLVETEAIPQKERPHTPYGDAIDTLKACPGCGAFAQIIEPGVAGHYTLKRKAVLSYLQARNVDITKHAGDLNRSRLPEDEVLQKALGQADPALVEELQLNDLLSSDESVTHSSTETPLCDRCHDLLYHSQAKPIVHPSIESLYDTMEETAFKYNHVYHVLDAADFPMSLIPSINRLLDISPLRSKNRRSKHTHFKHGRSIELSFVITRSDLLAPTKQQVDSVMPTMTEILRDALGSVGQGVRLGNVRCVSAKRGWWVSQLKKEIWEQGGASWMVGKVNVGKSNLFQAVFPKGHTDELNLQTLKEKARAGQTLDLDLEQLALRNLDSTLQQEHRGKNPIARGTPKEGHDEEENVLLPPARPETPYPTMPVISSLPGTTASPIRIPFGGGKGELIDLPGLSRSSFFDLVAPEYQDDLVMKRRVIPEQQVIRPGQSLMLGGLVRITPVNQDLDFLAYPFMNIRPHLTSTAKAVEFEAGERSRQGLSSVITKKDPNTAQAPLVSAGKFTLKWDETKKRTGPLTARAAGKLNTSMLPFRVFSADVLVEGVGWVEMAVQVRKRTYEPMNNTASESGAGAGHNDIPEHQLPQVEVFSPEGKHVAVRRPLGAWMLNKPLGKAMRPQRRWQRVGPKR